MDYGHLKGIGGWLLLILFGLLYTLVQAAINLNDSKVLFQPEVWHTITTYGSGAYHPLFGTWVIYETTLNILTAVLIICLLVLMFRKSRFFPKLMIFYFVSAVFFQGIDYYLSYTVLTDLPEVAKVMGASPDYDGLLRALVQVAVWVPYFIKSQRVKVTFLTKETNIYLEKEPIGNDI